MKCTFCNEDCDGTLILRDVSIIRTDGKDVVLCKICFNLYANNQFDELTERLEKLGRLECDVEVL